MCSSDLMPWSVAEATALASALPKLKQLLELRIINCSISDLVAQALAAGLVQCRRLAHLHLNNRGTLSSTRVNAAMANDGKHFKNAVSPSMLVSDAPSGLLRTLNLRFNHLASKACCVARLRSVEEVDVRYCGLDVRDAMQLLRELLMCPRMKIVCIFEATPTFKARLSELHDFVHLKRNKRLQLFAPKEVSQYVLNTSENTIEEQ